MVSSAPPRLPYDNGQATEDDWPAQVADTIERVVGNVRDATTGRALTVVAGIVYGTFAVILATPVLVMVAIMLVRLLNVYLPDALVGEDHMWVAHLLIGALFTVGGGVLWMRRRGKEHLSAS